MLTNFHTHTKRCLHAYGTEEDYIKAAVSEGLVMLGFSDHAPFPDYDFGMRMPYSELDDYISTLDILKEKYKNKIKLFRGLEIEYHAKYLDYYHSLLDEKGFDYAYRYPGMNKVLQAAGRVIRTEEDRGVVALLDERFLERDYQRLFPREWEDHVICRVDDVMESLEQFWGNGYEIC